MFCSRNECKIASVTVCYHIVENIGRINHRQIAKVFSLKFTLIHQPTSVFCYMVYGNWPHAIRRVPYQPCSAATLMIFPPLLLVFSTARAVLMPCSDLPNPVHAMIIVAHVSKQYSISCPPCPSFHPYLFIICEATLEPLQWRKFHVTLNHVDNYQRI